jgi:hypothetical protein
LKGKIYLYVNSNTQRCPNKITKTFLIEDFSICGGEKEFCMCFNIRNAIYFFLDFHKEKTPELQEQPLAQQQKRTSSSQNIFSSFQIDYPVLHIYGYIRLDPDPGCQTNADPCRSGSWSYF